MTNARFLVAVTFLEGFCFFLNPVQRGNAHSSAILMVAVESALQQESKPAGPRVPLEKLQTEANEASAAQKNDAPGNRGSEKCDAVTKPLESGIIFPDFVRGAG